ncbi:hypothetical protein GJ744_000454 [Endocarpon pusillum]|uniref:tryptophan--tRNA ligase n=1 Tax=Endocarpon pusillum TaxID=364733 RepID=A0A8H7E2K0_9EURO|nr:hypothetical protein GJ744_000454 [Endocarpon pusillum]
MQPCRYNCRALEGRLSTFNSHRRAFCNSSLQGRRSIYSTALHDAPTRIIFSGVQPTGVPHLGNYLGAFRPWVRLQNERSENDILNFSIVDYHALTVPQNPELLWKWNLETYSALLAVGLDPKISRIFFQSRASYAPGSVNVSIANDSRWQSIQS